MIRKVILGALICLYVWLLIIIDLPGLNMKYMSMFVSTAIFALTLLGLIVCCLAMLFGKAWAKNPLLILNGIYLLFGFYMLYFAWTFYIFDKPTLAQHLNSMRMPIIVGVLVPLIIFRYFSKGAQSVKK